MKWFFLGFLIFNIISFLLFRFKPYHALFLALRDFKKSDKKSFKGYGFWLFVGLGGSGKTVSMVEYLDRMKKKYPLVKIYTNFNYIGADGKIDKWEDIIDIENVDENGNNQGVIFGFDEIHLTFSSDQWKDAPPNMLEYISQQRKLKKQIVSSSQVFNRINIKLREQTNYVIECKTLWGRWTFNKAFHTQEYLANGELGDKGIRKRVRAWRYNFIQTDYIRSLFDTMQLMCSLKNDKFTSTLEVSRLKDLLSDI